MCVTIHVQTDLLLLNERCDFFDWASSRVPRVTVDSVCTVVMVYGMSKTFLSRAISCVVVMCSRSRMMWCVRAVPPVCKWQGATSSSLNNHMRADNRQLREKRKERKRHVPFCLAVETAGCVIAVLFSSSYHGSTLLSHLNAPHTSEVRVFHHSPTFDSRTYTHTHAQLGKHFIIFKVHSFFSSSIFFFQPSHSPSTSSGW